MARGRGQTARTLLARPSRRREALGLAARSTSPRVWAAEVGTEPAISLSLEPFERQVEERIREILEVTWPRDGYDWAEVGRQALDGVDLPDRAVGETLPVHDRICAGALLSTLVSEVERPREWNSAEVDEEWLIDEVAGALSGRMPVPDIPQLLYHLVRAGDRPIIEGEVANNLAPGPTIVRWIAFGGPRYWSSPRRVAVA